MYIGVSNLLTREVFEWMGMGVATMPVTEMNRCTKPACTCLDQYISAYMFVFWKIIVRMDMQFNKCECI